jgi:mRNA interferase MazF
MHKDFDAWHRVKLNLQEASSRPYFYEREIWWAAIGCNIGDEEDGKGTKYARPVLVVRKFNSNLFFAVPLSSVVKSGKYYHQLSFNGRPAAALLSHLRDYDARRLLDKIGVASKAEYAQIQEKLAALMLAPGR